MKRLLKFVVIAVVILLVAAGVAITYVTQALPDIAVKELKVELTPERIARGEYLANHVCVCMDCHSTRNWNAFSGPLIPGTLGKGGERFDESMNFPGTFYSANITPFNVGSWSDGELYRVIVSGVAKDGHPMFPVMPYLNYGKMDEEDIHSLIAYVRSLDPLESRTEKSEAVFPVSVIMHTMPQPPAHVKRPDPSDEVAYGKYLVNASGCGECHTRTEKGKKVGEPFAGGFAFNFPTGDVVRSVNITPSEDGGLGRWTREQFIARFKMYADSGYTAPPVNMMAHEFQTVMPWTMYAGMTEQDLGAIYAYLRTVPVVDGMVERWTPAQ